MRKAWPPGTRLFKFQRSSFYSVRLRPTWTVGAKPRVTRSRVNWRAAPGTVRRIRRAVGRIRTVRTRVNAGRVRAVATPARTGTDPDARAGRNAQATNSHGRPAGAGRQAEARRRDSHLGFRRLGTGQAHQSHHSRRTQQVSSRLHLYFSRKRLGLFRSSGHSPPRTPLARKRLRRPDTKTGKRKVSQQFGSSRATSLVIHVLCASSMLLASRRRRPTGSRPPPRPCDLCPTWRGPGLRRSRYHSWNSQNR